MFPLQQTNSWNILPKELSNNLIQSRLLYSEILVMNAVDDYISGFPPDVRKMLKEIRRILRESAPEATELINYGMPTLKMGENLVHFAGYKNYVGFYPGASAILAFRKELSPYRTSTGTVRFPLDKPIPYDLIKTITEFRVKEVLKKV